MEWWVGNLAVVFLFFLCAATAALVILWPLRGQPSSAWRGVNIAIVSLGSLGLLSAATVAARQANEIRAAISRPWAISAGLPIQSHATWAVRYYCRQVVRQPTSPPDFDDMVAEFNRMCEWANRLSSVVGRIDFNDLPPLDEDVFRDLPEVTKTPFLQDNKHFRDMAKRYLDVRKSAVEAQQNSSVSHLERGVVFLSPFAIAVALALALAKAFHENRQRSTI